MFLFKPQNLGAICIAVVLFLVATSAMAHPVTLPGIDVDSVLTMRDQARQLGHQYGDDDEADTEVKLDEIRTIVIDPGHGGDNSGATGVAGVPEKVLTLDLAYQLRDRLQRRHPHLRVIMTRYGDDSVDLNERVHMANLAGADLFVSLHYNAAPHDRAIGFETYFPDAEQVTPGEEQPQGLPVATIDGSVTGIQESIEGVTPIGQNGDTLELIRQDLLRAHRHDLSGALAEAIQDRFVDRIDSVDRGVKQGNFTILQGTHMPAVVVEAGFLTHPEEGFEVLEEDHRTEVTEALVEAVETFDDQLTAHLDEPKKSDEASVAEQLDDELERIE